MDLMRTKPVKEILAPWELKKRKIQQHRKDITERYNEVKPYLKKYRNLYKKALNFKPGSKYHKLKREFILNALRHEKNEIDLRLDVVQSKTYKREIDIFMKTIEKSVNYLDKINEDTKFTRSCIKILKSSIFDLDKEMMEKMSKIYHGISQLDKMGKIENKVNNLKGRHEAFVRREGTMFMENDRLRKIIIDMLHERALFNKLWNEMIAKLNRDKWYLIDSFEYAMLAFDNSVNIYNMFQMLDGKFKRKEYEEIMTLFGNNDDLTNQLSQMNEEQLLQNIDEKRKIDVDNILRKIAHDKDSATFMETKTKERKKFGLEALEYENRREVYQEIYREICEMYKFTLQQVLPNGISSLEDVLEKCEEQERFRYSYWVYLSFINNQVLNLRNNVDEVYEQIDLLRKLNSERIHDSIKTLKEKQQKLEYEHNQTKMQNGKKVEINDLLNKIFQGIYDLVSKADCDLTYLKHFLGDHTQITVFNVQKFLKILQKQLNFIIFCVYMNQRDKIPNEIIKEPTPLKNIVLVHQCPECAERDDVVYDFGPANLMTMQEIRAKMRRKVKLPNMRERLHGISQCTMPRSRLIRPRLYFSNLLSLL